MLAPMFIQLLDENEVPYLVNLLEVDSIGPHAYKDRDGEEYRHTIVSFRSSGPEQRKPVVVRKCFSEVINLLRGANDPVIILEGTRVVTARQVWGNK